MATKEITRKNLLATASFRLKAEWGVDTANLRRATEPEKVSMERGAKKQAGARSTDLAQPMRLHSLSVSCSND